MGLQHSVGFPLPPLCVDTNCQDKKASLVPSTLQAPISLYFFLLSSAHKRGSLTASRPASLQQSEDSWTNIKSSATLQREEGKKASVEPLKNPILDFLTCGELEVSEQQKPQTNGTFWSFFFAVKQQQQFGFKPWAPAEPEQLWAGSPWVGAALADQRKSKIFVFPPQTQRGEKPQKGEGREKYQIREQNHRKMEKRRRW